MPDGEKKRDQLGVVGFISAIAKNLAQQRSLAKARAKGVAVPPGAEDHAKPKKPRDTRTPEQIRGAVDGTRADLVRTVDALKYDLDVPSRARDARDRLARRIPASWRGEPRATIVAASVLLSGLAAIAGGIAARVRR